MNSITKILPLFCVYFVFASAMGQEIERDLKFVPTGLDRDFSQVQTSRGGILPMSLPFLDDFAWPSFEEENIEGDHDLIRWETSPVRRTQTFSKNVPTIGVATLDGLDAGGYPYQFNGIDVHGWADTLTSRQIYLEGYTLEDEVTLSFWLQGGGIGNAPDFIEDQLIVEFKSIGLDGDIWTQVWETTGVLHYYDQNDNDITEEVLELIELGESIEDSYENYQTEYYSEEEFIQVVIPIDAGEYLHSTFQFRFRNYGTLMGNADLWHIDYVFVEQGGITGNPSEEIAFSEPAYSLLKDFSAMPWTHFSEFPELYIRNNLEIESNNFGIGLNNQENTGITIRHSVDGAETNKFTSESIQNVSVDVGTFTTEFLENIVDENGNSATLNFDTSLSDSTAVFEVSLWEEEIGYETNHLGVFDNDSIGFNQVFSNYYAYDDGTAEKAYALDAIGGQLALRFPLAKADTLDGVLIHFTPFYENASDETFVLKVWEDDDLLPGTPGELVIASNQFHNPVYFTEGHDMFAFYPLDEPLEVSGVIHVGLIQQNIERLNIGLDKNTNANIGNLHYMLGPGSSWAASEIEGSLMLRPVLRAGGEFAVDVPELQNFELITSPYPNPTSSPLMFNACDELVWAIFNLNGKHLAEGQTFPGVNSLDLSSLSEGMYLLQLKTKKGFEVEYHQFVIQR